VLIHPLREGRSDLAEKYRRILLGAKWLRVLPVSIEVAEVAAALRAKLNLGTPDAIQLASALNGGASYFVTNDAGLGAVDGLSVLTLDSVLAK
jgi:predicted nucleic acid-binding protein